MYRLTLVPGIRRLIRHTGVVQLGADPASATVLDLPDARLGRVLELLDGTRTERAVLREAATFGVSADHVQALLEALRGLGILITTAALAPDSMPEPQRRQLLTEAAAITMRHAIPPPDPPPDPVPADPRLGASAVERPATRPRSAASTMRRRAGTTVLVTGRGRIATPLCAALAAAGIGRVGTALTGRAVLADCAPGGLTPADAERPRGIAAAEAIARAAPYADTSQVRSGTATFTVQIGLGVPPELTAYSFARRAQPHLLIEERDTSVTVGPLVDPGRTACLRCLDLHRRALDDAWPAIAAQLATAPDDPPPIATATLLVAVGVAAAYVLAYIDGDRPALDGTIDIRPPACLTGHPLPPHPACGCVGSGARRRR